MVTAAARPAIRELVQSGFAAQVRGRLLEAAERYEEVHKLDPLHFDATHMLGVVQYHRGRFDDALRLLTRAVELQPNAAEAWGNLDIVQTARRRERELCRGVLPRLAILVLDEYARRCTTHPLTVLHQQNAGTHDALNHGLALARGDWVALINSDDLYAATRLECCLKAMIQRNAAFVFSGTSFVNEAGAVIGNDDRYVAQLRDDVARGFRTPDPVYALIRSNRDLNRQLRF